MSLISTWSTVANDNGTLGSTPFYWPEGQAPSTVNDCARQMMATIRAQWNDAQWFNWGYAVTNVSGTSFTLTTQSWNTVTIANVFATGGRIKIYDTVPNTLYGTITTVSVSAASVQVSFTPDVSSLTATVTSVFNSIITADQKSIPSAAVPADVVRQSGAQIYGVDAGTTDAYAVSLTPNLTSYAAGESFNIFCNTANTGAATLNIDSLGAKSITFPDGSALTDNFIAAGSIIHVVYDGTKFLLISQNSSGGGGASAATQADMEAGTSTTTYVSPGRIQYSPASAKAWAEVQTTGVSAASYNVASIVDVGTGIVTVNLSTDFSSSNYQISTGTEVTVTGSTASTMVICIRSTLGAGSFTADCVNMSTFAGTDPNYYHFSCFGDQ